ncbi:MAG: DUF721 domain-containing protein [Verrucomicrobia bacterium]|jgi:predicted nucleic acid-binding Zn ribbon protein|nr:DUF721 domain-containing protein [Verrucomicrobiota bacterium]
MAESPKQRMKRGQWEVHCQRCRLERGPQPPTQSEGDAIGKALPRLMKGLGLDSEHWVETLSDEWVAIVGAAVGKHTRPGRLDGCQLSVFVDSSVWLNELKRYGLKQMLQNLQARFGASRIRNLRLQLDPESRSRR